MENILDKVNFDTHIVYDIKLTVEESYLFNNLEEGAASEDENGQSLDPVSDVRRTIKYSYPFENKKIIKSINVEDEKDDVHGNTCRDVSVHYYLLVDKEEEEEFCTEILHDELEEEWRDGSECKVQITPYEK